MKKTMLALFVALSLGCVHADPPPCVPLVTPCPPPPARAFIRPDLAIKSLRETDDAPTVLKAYVLTVKALEDHVLYLETVLNGYRK